MIPINQVATVALDSGEAEINRENLQSMGVITARMEKTDLGTVIPAIKKSIDKNVVLPQGYHIEYGGEYAEQQQSFKELLNIFITASLLLFGVDHFPVQAIQDSGFNFSYSYFRCSRLLTGFICHRHTAKCRQLYRHYYDSRHHRRKCHIIPSCNLNKACWKAMFTMRSSTLYPPACGLN